MIRRPATESTSPKRRTTVLAAGVLLAGVPLLAACGTPHAGAAAVVGGEQITVSALQDTVNAVRQAQDKLPNADQVRQQSEKLVNTTLHTMVLERVVAKAVDNAGIKVTRSELQKFRHAQEASQGGARTFRQLLLQQGVAPNQINSILRTDLSLQKLVRQQGADPATPQGQRQIFGLLARASRELKVDVNPRYGKWSTTQLAITPAADGWLHKRQPEQRQF